MKRLLGFSVMALVVSLLVSPVYARTSAGRVDASAKKGCGCGVEETNCCCCKSDACSARTICDGIKTCTCSCNVNRCSCSCSDDENAMDIGSKLVKWDIEREVFKLGKWDDDYTGVDTSFLSRNELRPFDGKPVAELLNEMTDDDGYELIVTPQAVIRVVKAPFRSKQIIPTAQKGAGITFCTSRINTLVFAGYIAVNTSCPVVLKVRPATLVKKTVNGFFKGAGFEDVAKKALKGTGLSISRRNDGAWELGMAPMPKLD